MLSCTPNVLTCQANWVLPQRITLSSCVSETACLCWMHRLILLLTLTAELRLSSLYVSGMS